MYIIAFNPHSKSRVQVGHREVKAHAQGDTASKLLGAVLHTAGH